MDSQCVIATPLLLHPKQLWKDERHHKTPESFNCMAFWSWTAHSACAGQTCNTCIVRRPPRRQSVELQGMFPNNPGGRVDLPTYKRGSFNGIVLRQGQRWEHLHLEEGLTTTVAGEVPVSC